MKKRILYQLIGLIPCLFFLGACQEKKAQQTEETIQAGSDTAANKSPIISSTPTTSSPDMMSAGPKMTISPNANITIKTFQQPAHGWGYDVYLNDKLYIHQPHIPAIGGNQGFRDEATAHKTAKFIEWKIRHNIIPPSIRPQELDSLGVL